jgi:hypothetical protein
MCGMIFFFLTSQPLDQDFENLALAVDCAPLHASSWQLLARI